MRQNQSYTNSAEAATYTSATTKSSKISLISGIVACICIIVYLGSIVFAGIRVYTGVADRRILASREFSNLAKLSAAIGTLGGLNDSFKETITNEILHSKTLQGVIFSGSRGEYAFERDPETIITWNRDSPSFKFQFGLSKVPLSQSLKMGNQVVTLQAVYTYIDYELLITILKRTLLVVLATLCLALFTLIFQFLLANPTYNADTKEESSFTDIPHTDKTSRYEDKYEDKKDDTQEEQLVAGLEKDILPPRTTPIPPVPVPEETIGLYGSRSYIGREIHAQERLIAELKRCTSFGQDLVLMAIEMQGSEQPVDKEFRFLADEAVKLFLRRDLIFEKGDRGIMVILPSIDLDQGFTKSEKFFNRIVTKYAETFENKVELYIGLSSRVDRAIDAERLIFEVSGALKKSKEDPASPIVAFRSDPEKYKAFIAAQNKSRS